jgi:anaerobic ribonucleoside-triphosphate reductase activating protein
MRVRIASIVTDSIVDGPGLRYAVFTQGCPHRCPGCHNPDTHDPAGGRWATCDELERSMLQSPMTKGLTLSGGEPFLQAAACAELAASARRHGLDVWVYTGYTWGAIRAARNPDWEALLAVTDVLVDGPFMQERRSYTARFRGSSNQRIINVPASLKHGRAVLWRSDDPLAHFIPPAL